MVHLQSQIFYLTSESRNRIFCPASKSLDQADPKVFQIEKKSYYKKGELKINFQDVDRRYDGLKQQYDNGSLSDEEFDAQLKQMMVQDDEGRWWAKSRQTGDWNYYDGNTWVRDTPPETKTVQKPPPVQPPPVQPPPVQPSPVQLPPVHQNGGQQRRRGCYWGVVVGVISVVAVLIILVVVWLGLGEDVTVDGGGSDSGDSVDFTIRGNLSPGNTATGVTIIIDGRNVGTLAVNQSDRTDELDVSMSSGPGRYGYTASGTTQFQDGRTFSGTGQGTIEVGGGEVFEVQGSGSGNNWQITLVEQ